MLRHVVDALRLEHPLWLIDSQAKHAVVASGVADILLRFPTRRGFHDAIWDQAVGSLLVEEAGGRVTDLAGHSLDFSVGRHLSKNEGIVATNGVLHDSVVKAIQRARAEPRALGPLT
jgi:3'(2'), 5'-bisphosphate nucleotidase